MCLHANNRRQPSRARRGRTGSHRLLRARPGSRKCTCKSIKHRQTPVCAIYYFNQPALAGCLLPTAATLPSPKSNPHLIKISVQIPQPDHGQEQGTLCAEIYAAE